MAADWDSASALWRVTVRSDVGSETTVRCRWLFVATGYYDYERGHRPHFPDEEVFRGPILHPQAWPEEFDAKGKRIAVIGSGATAVTLVPALAEAGAQVTQTQRTPSYILPFPSEDAIANALRRVLPETTAYAIARRKNIRLQQSLYALFQRYPKAARRFLRWTNRRLLPKGYPVDVHFNPPYDPWDQRLCIAPAGDFLKAIRSGRVSIVTGGIERFTPGGVRMNSGEEIAAGVVVAATGLAVTLLRGTRLSLDGVPVDLPERMVFKGTMLDGVPNLCFVFGYVNASWTLRADLISRFFCRLLKGLDARGEAVCVVQRPEGETGDRRPSRLVPFFPAPVDGRLALGHFWFEALRRQFTVGRYAKMARPKLQVTKMKARLERLAAEREALAHTRNVAQVFSYLTRETLERVDAERKLYPVPPARSAVLCELVIEALAFRRAHRSPPKPQREPFVFKS
jgi:monooxygenase